MEKVKGYPHKWWVLAVLVFSLLVIGFDTTILTVALPVLTDELGASTTELQWIVNMYVLLLAAFILAAGSLGDRFGRKKVLLIGLVVFGIASVIAGFSTTTEILIISRGLMGMGAAIMMPLTISILPTVFPPDEQGKAISIWSAGMGVGLLIGPLIGGYILEHFNWGAIFFINIPMIIIAMTGVTVLVPESKDSRTRKIDWLGMVLSSAGLILIVYALTEAPEKGWDSMTILITLITGVTVLFLFVLWQWKATDPMLDLGLLQNARFTWATVAGVVMMFIMAGILFFITQYLAFFYDATPFESGVKLMPLIGAYTVGAIGSNGLVKIMSRKWAIVTGLMVLGIGMYLFTLLTADNTYGDMVYSFVVQGAGMGLMLAPAMDAVMESLHLDEVGIGSAVNNALRQVGTTLGIAIMGSVISYVYADGVQDSARKMMPEAPADMVDKIADSIGAAKHMALTLENPLQKQVLLEAGNAFLDGVHTAMWVGIGGVLLAMVTTILFFPSRGRKQDETIHAKESGHAG